jgi:tryptophan synthase alpha chain
VRRATGAATAHRDPAAADIALHGGVRIADVIRTVREAYQATGKPVLVTSYWNPIDKYGAERFSSELAEAGGAGCILPDLPVQESGLWRESAARHSLATIFVAAPSCPSASESGFPTLRRLPR